MIHGAFNRLETRGKISPTFCSLVRIFIAGALCNSILSSNTNNFPALHLLSPSPDYIPSAHSYTTHISDWCAPRKNLARSSWAKLNVVVCKSVDSVQLDTLIVELPHKTSHLNLPTRCVDNRASTLFATKRLDLGTACAALKPPALAGTVDGTSLHSLGSPRRRRLGNLLRSRGAGLDALPSHTVTLALVAAPSMVPYILLDNDFWLAPSTTVIMMSERTPEGERVCRGNRVLWSNRRPEDGAPSNHPLFSMALDRPSSGPPVVSPVSPPPHGTLKLHVSRERASQNPPTQRAQAKPMVISWVERTPCGQARDVKWEREAKTSKERNPERL